MKSAFSLPWPFRTRSSASPPSEAQRSSEHRKPGDPGEDERILEEFGVTAQLCDFVRGFDASSFRDFPLLDNGGNQPRDGSGAVVSNVRNDLTEWQERHATLVLSRVKSMNLEISQLRYTLCPRQLKEQQFWRIYFLLVKKYTAPYEIRAIQKAKIKMMETETDKLSSKPAIEVEMTDVKTLSGSLVQ